MTSEKLYALATENLEVLCNGYAKECNIGPAHEFFENAKAHPADYARYHPALAAALEIWSEAREDILKEKNGSAYSAVKKFMKSTKKSVRNVQGAWTDSAGRQCFCDGYRAFRLKKHMVGFDEVDGIDLDKLWPDTTYYVPLELPRVGDLKVCIAEQKGRDRKFYDFGDGLPRVNAEYLLNMMQIFPHATAKSCGLNKPIVFECEDGDGILLPVHKQKTA